LVLTENRDNLRRIIAQTQVTGARFDSSTRFLVPSSEYMRKCAALARALALDPPLLFCDDPSAGLDPVTLEALDTLLLKLKIQLGMTILLVTHEVSSIFRLADRIIFIEEGRVTYQGNFPTTLNTSHPARSEFFSKAKGKGDYSA
jgi:phospholipid/cholesterol/gamma-HCH transport system ATP-binding protein